MPPELALEVPVASEALGRKIDQLLAVSLQVVFRWGRYPTPQPWPEVERLIDNLRREWPRPIGPLRHAGYVFTLSGRGLAMVREP